MDRYWTLNYVGSRGRETKVWEDKVANLATHDETNNKKSKAGPKGKKNSVPKWSNEFKCFFYKKKRHMKKDCLKHKKWLEKKGKSFVYICHEFHFIEAPNNTW